MVILNLKSHGYHWNEDSKFPKKYFPKPVVEYKIITPPKHYLVPPQKNNSKNVSFLATRHIPGPLLYHFEGVDQQNLGTRIDAYAKCCLLLVLRCHVIGRKPCHHAFFSQNRFFIKKQWNTGWRVRLMFCAINVYVCCTLGLKILNLDWIDESMNVPNISNIIPSNSKTFDRSNRLGSLQDSWRIGAWDPKIDKDFGSNEFYYMILNLRRKSSKWF